MMGDVVLTMFISNHPEISGEKAGTVYLPLFGDKAQRKSVSLRQPWCNGSKKEFTPG
jgi:hypothetical protein